jgi:undecaprenyl-diphosphatase
VPLLHLVVLAVVQGITEFLPVSSSGHLVLVPVFAGWPDQGLLMDVAVHVGTLGAVMVYLSRDIWEIIAGLFNVARGRRDPKAALAGYIILATLPVIGAGYFLNQYYPDGIRSIIVIGWTTLGFGLFLAVTDWMGMTLRRMEHIRFVDALVIGLLQVLALIPGTSRSGITMSAARLLGFERHDAARFSMLLSIPVILGAGTLKGLELYQSGDQELTYQAFVAAGLAFVAALIAIAVMMAWLRKSTFAPFVLYRVALGVVLLAVAYGFIT